ncbi:hypothetical protein SAZ11_00465 [Streptomyces sp. FXJ1.4098]|nr:hypothetical protein [Streptomyces sp. FXJ1.4098]
MRKLARRLALTGLRNHRAGAPLPEVLIVGFGNDVRSNAELPARQEMARERGARRAQAVYAHLTQELAVALATLQRDLPADQSRLGPHDFELRKYGLPEVPPTRGSPSSPGPR